MKTLLKGAFVGGWIVFIWGAISWMALPFHGGQIHSFQDERQVARALLSNTIEPGVYVLPAAKPGTLPSDKAAQKIVQARMRQMQKGPFAFLVMNPHGLGPLPVQLARAFAIQFLGALLLTWLLMQVRGVTPRRRVFFCIVFAMAAAVVGLLPSWNWWGFPDRTVLLDMLDLLAGWGLAGLYLARLTAPDK